MSGRKTVAKALKYIVSLGCLMHFCLQFSTIFRQYLNGKTTMNMNQTPNPKGLLLPHVSICVGDDGTLFTVVNYVVAQWKPSNPIGHEDSVALSVCAKFTFPLLDGVFTPKLLLPYRNVGQQQAA
jgi:hypothetical protein